LLPPYTGSRLRALTLRLATASYPQISIMRTIVLRIIATLSLLFAASTLAADSPPILFQEDFEKGADRWQPQDPDQWQIKKTDRGQVYSQHKKASAFKPPHRAPTNVSLLNDEKFGDMEFTGRVQSTHPDYGHRDAVVVFGYQDPAHFYYVHLGKKADDHANQIFIVNGADRLKISKTSTDGTNWTDNWHTVKIIRKPSDGAIEIYFDNLQKPVMTASDKTFGPGRIGVGTFDDTADWDDITIRAAP
jgi:hypothetical protein